MIVIKALSFLVRKVNWLSKVVFSGCCVSGRGGEDVEVSHLLFTMISVSLPMIN